MLFVQDQASLLVLEARIACKSRGRFRAVKGLSSESVSAVGHDCIDPSEGYVYLYKGSDRLQKLRVAICNNFGCQHHGPLVVALNLRRQAV